MSAEDFQLINTKKIDISIIKRDFIKIYHQSGANVDAENSQIKFYFGENIRHESEDEINNSSLKRLLIDNHTEANRGLKKGHLPSEYIFVFARSCKKITKRVGFELDLRTSKRKQDILYKILGDNDVNVTINSISLFVPQIIPSPETQVIFNEAFSKTFILSYETWTTDRKPVDTAREFQIDISSASNIKSTLYLIAAHQKTQRPDPANPANNLSNNRFKNAIFDHVEVRKYYSEIDGFRYPKNPVMVNYGENNYLEQYRDLKMFYKEYAGEQLLSPIMSYDKTKNYYPIQIIDLRFEVDHISPKKIRLFEEYDPNRTNTNLYVILMKHREI